MPNAAGYLEATARAATRLTSVASVDAVWRALADALTLELGARWAQMWSYDSRANALVLCETTGQGAPGQVRVAIDDPQHPAARAARDRTLLSGQAGAPDVTAIPLVSSGELLGVATTARTERSDAAGAAALAALAAIATGKLADALRCTSANAARVEAENALRRQTVLARASAALLSSADVYANLESLCAFVVPTLADSCSIQLDRGDGTIEQVAMTHVDPGKLEAMRQLQLRYPVASDSPWGSPLVMRTGRSDYWPEIPSSILEVAARDAEHLQLLKQLACRSWLCVPLIGDGAVLGTMNLLLGSGNRSYSPADLSLAEDLGRRAGAAVALTRAAGIPPQQKVPVSAGSS
jgi:hypothetical protein